MKILLKEKINHINSLILPYLEQSDGYNDQVVEAIKYSFQAGGKRLRPLIILSTFEMLSDQTVDISHFLAAIEMIHTYSLIHDDLPAMDDDDLRRGKPSCHIAFGEDIAILAGDGLLNLAYETLFEALILQPKFSKASLCLAKASGVHGMVGGQVVDVTNQEGKIDKDTLTYIHLHKTGALIKAAFQIGGYLAEADSQTIALLGEIGELVGLSFQIQDDLLDITSNEAELGKPIASDAKNHKDNYISLYGMTDSIKNMNDMFELAINKLNQINNKKSTFLYSLLDYMRDRKN